MHIVLFGLMKAFGGKSSAPSKASSKEDVEDLIAQYT